MSDDEQSHPSVRKHVDSSWVTIFTATKQEKKKRATSIRMSQILYKSVPLKPQNSGNELGGTKCLVLM